MQPYSNKKKQSSTLPPMPSKEAVKQKLKTIAGALLKGSRLSDSESFMIKTPALAALHDEARFTQITNMSANVLSHHVAKLLIVHLNVHPENMQCLGRRSCRWRQSILLFGWPNKYSWKWWSKMPAFCYCLASEASSRRRIHPNPRPRWAQSWPK